ncbi:MAG: WD40 repeat domain-containing protein, partial [Dolichospermum sp.]
ELVGINGLSVSNGNSRAVDFAGIPINEYKKYQNIFIVSQPTPTPQPTTRATFTSQPTPTPQPTTRATFTSQPTPTPQPTTRATFTPQPNPDNTFNFTLAQTLTDHSGDVKSVAWRPDGRTLASGSVDDTIKIWYGRTGNLLRTLSGHSD